MEFKQMTRNKYYNELEQADGHCDVRNKIVRIISADTWMWHAAAVAAYIG